jgi:ribosome-associated translation inhibitor RaiA
MNYNEKIESIKMDVQAPNITLSNRLQQRIRNMMARLQRYVSQVNWADVYLTERSAKSTDPRMVRVRLGIPGPDVFATGTGRHWPVLLKTVEEKLRRQLQKR